MDGKQESRMVWTFFVVFIAIIVISLLFGCKTKTVTITETVYVHDTVASNKTDTLIDIRVKTDSVVEYKFLTLHDTTIIERGKTIVLKENGDTIRQSEWEKIWQKIREMESLQHNESHMDSTSYYKATIDSLRQALHEAKSKDKVVTKTKYVVRWWEYLVLLLIVGITIFFVLKKGGKTFVDKI